MVKLSIVIPTLNGGALFGEVLAALRRQTLQADEILVIDSGSRDDTVRMAQDAGAIVHAIDPKTFNHGLTRNEGISRSTGEIVVLMTQDAQPADERLLENLAGAFEDPAVGGAYARQLPRPEHDVLVRRNVSSHLAGLAEPVTRHIADAAAYERLSPMERYIFCNFDNVCSAVRRSAWEKVPFRHNDFGEDIDWSKRALEAGYKIAYVPGARVIHSHDRPVSYEYKRTYMCHRKLYELFELSTVPARRYVLRSFVHQTLKDSSYVLQNEPNLFKKVSLLARVPVWSLAGVLGQYHGARDQRLNRGQKKQGV